MFFYFFNSGVPHHLLRRSSSQCWVGLYVAIFFSCSRYSSQKSEELELTRKRIFTSIPHASRKRQKPKVKSKKAHLIYNEQILNALICLTWFKIRYSTFNIQSFNLSIFQSFNFPQTS